MKPKYKIDVHFEYKMEYAMETYKEHVMTCYVLSGVAIDLLVELDVLMIEHHFKYAV